MNLQNRLRKLTRKYYLLNPAVKAGIWFTVCNILQRGIQFIVTPFYTRLLSTEEYGKYGLFVTWLNLLMIFGTLNMSGGIYYNGLIKKHKEVNTYTSSLQILSFILTSITYCLMFILKGFFPKLIGIPLLHILLMFIFTLVYPAIEFWSAQKRISYSYRPIVAITMITALLTPIIGLVLVQFVCLGALGVIIGFVVVNVIINGIICIYSLIRGKFKVNINEWKETLRFSVPLIPHYLSQVILAQFDRIMIAFFCGESKTGIYTLAYQVGLIMSILTTGINNVFTPWIYQKLKTGAYKSIKKVTNTLLVFFMILTLVVILIAPEIIGILGTFKYKEAILVVPPVMMSSFVMFAYCTFGTVLFYFEDTKRTSFATACGAVLNIVMNAIFIPMLGYIAAGYTTFASYIVIFVLYYFFMKIRCNKVNLPALFDIQLISGMIIGLILFSIISMELYKFIVVRYVIVVVVSVGIIIKRKNIVEIFSTIK